MSIGRILSATAAAVVLSAAFAAPVSAQAEEITLDRELLTHYAMVHKAMNDARDEFHGKVGRVHDAEGRERARRELEEQVSSVLAEHEMTQEQYDQITLMISLDPEARALFDEILAELETRPDEA